MRLLNYRVLKIDTLYSVGTAYTYYTE